MGIEIYMAFVRTESDLFFSVGIDWLVFCADGRNWLGFRAQAETSFCEGIEWLDFYVGG